LFEDFERCAPAVEVDRREGKSIYKPNVSRAGRQSQFLHASGGLYASPEELLKTLATLPKGMVQEVDVTAEVATMPFIFLNGPLQGGGCQRGAMFEARTQRFQHILFIGFGRVKLQAEFAQPDLVKAFLHHLKSGHLLTDEQDLSPRSEGCPNDIRNSLALAGPRRSLDG